MKTILRLCQGLLLAFLLFLHSLLLADSVEFLKIFKTQLQILKAPNCSQELRASSKQTLFFRGGFNSENEKPITLTDSLVALEQYRGEPMDIAFSWPNSKHRVSENIGPLLGDLRNYLHASRGDIVLLGHSKGGAEILATLLQHPEIFLDSRIKNIVLIQSPLRGSSEADRLFREDGQAKFLFKALFKLIPGLDSSLLLGNGMCSLRRNEMKSLMNEAVALFFKRDIDHEALLEKLLIVRSQEPNRKNWPKELRQKRPPPEFVGDGVVDFSNQFPLELHQASLDRLGRSIKEISLTSDHFSLVLSGKRSPKDSLYRVAFTHSLLLYLELVVQQD